MVACGCDCGGCSVCSGGCINGTSSSGSGGGRCDSCVVFIVPFCVVALCCALLLLSVVALSCFLLQCGVAPPQTQNTPFPTPPQPPYHPQGGLIGISHPRAQHSCAVVNTH